MSHIIKSYGLFWSETDVFWGVGSSSGSLLGVPARARSSEPVDFREQIGIYVLYAGHEMIYVGQAGSGNAKLFSRLKKHRKDVLADRWDHFSWFGLKRALNDGKLSSDSKRAASSVTMALNHMEALLIAAAEPALNRQGGRFVVVDGIACRRNPGGAGG
jgi:hypothetical protein